MQVLENGDVYEGKTNASLLACGFGTLRAADGTITTGLWDCGYFEGRYEGDLEDGLPQGHGELWSTSGGHYSGSWMGGRKQGQGKMTFCDGSVYEGRWENNRPTGLGTMATKDGEFKGYWNKGWCTLLDTGATVTTTGDSIRIDEDKKGVIMFADGSVFEGKFVDPSFGYTGWPEHGRMTYTNGDVYEGDFSNCKRDGFGVMTYKSGEVYEGFWSADLRHGFGKQGWEGLWFHDCKYEGDVQNNMPHGRGRLFLGDGQVKEGLWYAGGLYVGEEKDDEPHGRGTCSWMFGDTYSDFEGEWSEGQPFKGRITYRNGKIYDGEMEDMKPSGVGSMTSGKDELRGRWRNGKLHKGWARTLLEYGVYVGEMEDGVRHGRGRIDYFNSNYKDGDWYKDQFLNGNGRLSLVVDDSPSLYEGGLRGNARHGRGVLLFADGTRQEGDWSHGVYIGVYEGERRAGRPHGRGTMTYSDQPGRAEASYEGQWQIGKYHGKGRAVYRDESSYDGYWVGGIKTGIGRQTEKNGDVYFGNFTNDLPDGSGEMTRKDGSYMKGVWSRGLFVSGTVKTHDQDGTYEGQSVNGIRHGSGTITEKNGAQWTGVWYRGGRYEGDMFPLEDDQSQERPKPHGHGTCRYPDGSVYEGWWREGHDTQGKITYPGGEVYSGDVMDGKPHGFGKMTSGTETKTGNWSRGVLLVPRDCCVCLVKKKNHKSICGDERHAVCQECFTRIDQGPCPLCRQRFVAGRKGKR